MAGETARVADKNLANETYNALLQEILSARLPSGTVVQERRMAARLGVSRSPMRDALGRLEGQGLLVRNSKGVLRIRVITLQDYLNALTMRLLVEPSAAALAASQMDEANLGRLLEEIDTLEKETDPEPVALLNFDNALHQGIAEASRNSFMEETIRQMRHYTTIFEQERTLTQNKPGIADHRAILDALQKRDADTARAAMTLHLERVRQGVLATY